MDQQTDGQTDRGKERVIVAFTRLKSYWAILVSPKKLGSVKTRSRKSLRLALKYTVHPKNRYWRKTWQYPLHPIAVGNWLTVGNRLLRLGDRINELCFRQCVHLLQVHNRFECDDVCKFKSTQQKTNLKNINRNSFSGKTEGTCKLLVNKKYTSKFFDTFFAWLAERLDSRIVLVMQ